MLPFGWSGERLERPITLRADAAVLRTRTKGLQVISGIWVQGSSATIEKTAAESDQRR